MRTTEDLQWVLQRLDAEIKNATHDFYRARGADDGHAADVAVEVKMRFVEFKVTILDRIAEQEEIDRARRMNSLLRPGGLLDPRSGEDNNAFNL